MDDEDFLALIELVERRLREVGAGELADPALYTVRHPETRELHVFEPRKRLIEMLAAFERHMKVRDAATYELALVRINERLRDSRLEAAIVLPAPGETREAPAALAEAPRLAEPRERVGRLIGGLLETYRPGGAAA